jgi:hypothetical protein
MPTFAFGLSDNQSGTGPAAITAASTAQATGTALSGFQNVVTTAAGETAVVLPATHAVGSPIVVRVTSATAGLLFPPVGGAINGGSTNASFSVAQNKPVVCFAHANGLDYTVVLSA